jgi:sodium transport system permease protein
VRATLIWQIALKELLSTLRDRRAIISSLLIPLLILPVMMLGLPLLLGGLFEREQETVTAIAIEGLAYLPTDLRKAIEKQNVAFSEVDDPKTAVETDAYVAAIAVPTGFEAAVLRGEQASLSIYKKQGSLRSELNASKLEDAIRIYEESLVAARLQAAGLDKSILEPITTQTIDASSKAERSSGQLAWLIPFFIAIWTLAGGQVVALDATAGEKERGTLEALLVSPVRRIEVVLGKFLATLAFGLLASIMAILGYILSGSLLKNLFGKQWGEGSEIVTLMGGSLTVTPLRVVLLLLSAVLLASLIAALLIGISMFARTYKEAQTYVAPLSFLLILPAIGLQFADFFGSNPVVYLIPILNVLIFMDDVVKGQAQLLPLILSWGSMLVFAALLLDFAYRSFKREGVIFRS